MNEPVQVAASTFARVQAHIRRSIAQTEADRYRFEDLARFNAEVARGIVHTPEWVAKMAAEQTLFDRDRDTEPVTRKPLPSLPPTHDQLNPNFFLLRHVCGSAAVPCTGGRFHYGITDDESLCGELTQGEPLDWRALDPHYDWLCYACRDIDHERGQ